MDRFASFVPGAECATVFCGILDPGTGELTYSSAAHPPGIVVHPDGRIVLLEGGRSLPLAIRQDAGRTEAAYVLSPRSTLLLYTDGLVERRGQPLTEGIAAAGAAVRDASGASLEELAARVMTRLAPRGGYEDDVAIVLYHHPAPLGVVSSAESGQLAPVRAMLRSWLRNCDIGAKTIHASAARGVLGHGVALPARLPPLKPSRPGRAATVPPWVSLSAKRRSGWSTGRTTRSWPR